MKKNILIIIVLFAVYFFTRKAMANDIETALLNKNVLAFLATIRRTESGGDYNIIYGGSHFDDMSGHPDIKVPFHNQLRSGEGNNDFSTAAGAYQINYPTWLSVQAVAFLPDFSKDSQDRAAVWLLKMHGILQDVIDGNFKSAVSAASKIWASFPFSDAQQNQAKYQTVLNTYAAYGGEFA